MNDLIDLIIRFRFEIAGALTMAAITAYLAEFNSRRSRLAAASEKFRNIFLTELIGLYPVPTNWPSDVNGIDRVLREIFPKLNAAVAEFRHFIPWYRRIFFDKAWAFYRLGEDGIQMNKMGGNEQQCYYQYMPFSGSGIINGKEISHDTTKTYKETFRKNVDNLLKYAKQI
jgi:hypothetical protein